MKTKSLCRVLGRGAVILSALAIPGMALAQQPGYAYPPPPSYNQPQGPYAQPQQPYASPQYQYPQGGQQGYPQVPSYAPPPESRSEFVSPMEFLPTFGRRFGQIFRKMFYGDGVPQGYEGMPGYQGNQPDYSLDNPPPYGSHYGPQTGITMPPQYNSPPRYETAPNAAPRYESPRYETPPAQAPGRTAAPLPQPYQNPRTPSVAEKKKSSSTPSKKYTPPSITRTEPGTTRSEPSQPKVQSQPPAPAPAKEKQKDASAPPGADYNFYPLPGSKPTTEKSSPPASTTARENTNGTNAGNKSAGTANSGSFLKGKRTNKEGRVISPYAPYQELDVTGLSSGSLALDPTTQKVFEVP